MNIICTIFLLIVPLTSSIPGFNPQTYPGQKNVLGSIDIILSGLPQDIAK